jgi:glycolate oxidase
MDLKGLTSIFPNDRVALEPERLAAFRDDITDADSRMAGAAVWPESVEEIQALVRWAGESGVPLTPRVANQNVGGLAIPESGGVVVDFTRMNRILEFSREDMYAIIEPGVTQEQLKAYLEEHAPELRIGYSLAPPDTSVLLNCLMDGLTNYSLRIGSMSEAILGLEAVLHDARVIKTGAWGVGPVPYGRPPLPDLTGLFVAWLGTTGIVTRGVLALWPKHPLRERLFILAQQLDATFAMVKRLVRLEICDDLGVLTWPTGRMMLGVERPGTERAEGEPVCFVYLDISAETPSEMDGKIAAARRVLAETGAGGALTGPLFVADLVTALPEMVKYSDFPTDLDFLTKSKGGGMTWVGTYGPMSTITSCCQACMDRMVEHGFPPAVVCRAMKTGHFAVLRFLEVFDRSSPEEMARVRTLNLELFDLALGYGYVQYKPPLSVLPRLHARMDPATLKTMQELKKMLDPRGIFCPSNLGLVE